jgi:hypothetical protein
MIVGGHEVTNKDKVIQAIREMAMIEIILDNPELRKQVEMYLCASIYNKINGIDTTIRNITTEISEKKELSDLLKGYQAQINNKIFEILERY